jgi:hypothetical protein
VKVFFGTVFPCKGALAMNFDLDAYRWKNRILIIFVPSVDSENYEAQKESLRNQSAGILDRDLRIVEVLEKDSSSDLGISLCGESARNLRNKFGVTADEFQVILIGKDGTVKLRSKAAVSPSALFQLIDAMPMRQEEMRKKEKIR